MKNFKELLIWQKGMEIWKQVHLISKELPESERFGVISQINRAAASIPANIAEGAGRNSNKDNARFLHISLGSSFELETFLHGILMLSFLTDTKRVEETLMLIDEEQKMIMSFIKKLEPNS